MIKVKAGGNVCRTVMLFRRACGLPVALDHLSSVAISISEAPRSYADPSSALVMTLKTASS